MPFELKRTIDLLDNYPAILESVFLVLPENILHSNEGGETWSPYEVLGHLIHGEKTDWIARTMIILEAGKEQKIFEPFDRLGHIKQEKKPLELMLKEFKTLRRLNIETLKKLGITQHHLSQTGIHPHLGEVKLSQLLATWVAHDWSHLMQINRVVVKQQGEYMGPWVQYFSTFTKK